MDQHLHSTKAIDVDYSLKDDPIGSGDLSVAVIPKNVPRITSIGGHDYWGEAFNAIFDFIGNNVMAPAGVFEMPWLRPGPAWKGAWVFETAFNAKTWSLCNPEFTRETLEALLTFQDMIDPSDDKEYGRIPHSITIKSIGPWAAPPLLEWAIWELFKKNGSIDMLHQNFSKLFAYHLWLNYNRDLHKNGLYSWVHASESCIENAPRFDAVAPQDCDAVDFSCLVSLQLRSLINMATILKDDTVIENLEARKQELDSWINEDLWDESTGFYYDKAFSGDHKGEFIGPKALTGWYPLFAGIVPKERLSTYLKHLTDREEFWTANPVPSVANDESSFDKNMNLFRGGTWVFGNYIIIKGLKGYGFRQLPGELAYLTVAHVFDTYQKKRNFYEFYNCLGLDDHIEQLTRKTETTGPRQYFIGSTGLVANLLLEDILGIEVQYDSILLNPSLPEKFTSKIEDGLVKGSLPGVPGWSRQDKIDFQLNFMADDVIEFEFTLANPMDVYVLEFSTREKIFSGDDVSIIQVEVKNNKDIISIFSKPEGESIKEDYLKRPDIVLKKMPDDDSETG
ncbi:MAG TPA: trehalase family glycosidase [Candidatus Lokiarchaeia archaeon]|nr:trehalase family glycosidase [Candidatus Lokiarchaeia archaeon]